MFTKRPDTNEEITNGAITKYLRSAHRNLDPALALTNSVAVLARVSADEVAELEKVNIETIFDLAASDLFADATQLVDAAEKMESEIARAGTAPLDLIDGAAKSIPVSELQLEPISTLRALTPARAQHLSQGLGVETIRNLALWPPYHSARAIANVALGGIEEVGDDPERPPDLMPATGRYPTERVQYEEILLDKIHKPGYYTRGNFLKVAAASGAAFLGGPLLAAAPAYAATHNGYVDSLTNYRMTQLTNWINWLAKTGAQGFIGEVEQPNNYNDRSKFTDQAQWAALADTYFTKCDSAGLVYTEQECSERYYNTTVGGYHASIYRSARDGSKSVSVPAYQSAVLEQHAGARPGMVGVNFSGGQKFDEGINSNTNPGTYNSLYWFPTANSNPVCPNTGMNSFQFLASRGIKIVRVGFRWERMQPSLNDALNPTELEHLKQCISNASAAGLSVIMDLHNYGGYCISSGRLALNSYALPVSAYQDVWKKLSAEFASEPTVVGYDIMNEPHVHGGIAAGSYGSAEKAWEAITQTVVDALRGLGDTTQIIIPTYCDLQNTPRKHTKPWIVNGGDIAYTSHDYWDDSSGDYRYDYSYYNRRVAKKGY